MVGTCRYTVLKVSRAILQSLSCVTDSQLKVPRVGGDVVMRPMCQCCFGRLAVFRVIIWKIFLEIFSASAVARAGWGLVDDAEMVEGYMTDALDVVLKGQRCVRLYSDICNHWWQGDGDVSEMVGGCGVPCYRSINEEFTRRISALLLFRWR